MPRSTRPDRRSLLERIDGWQRRHRVAAFPVAVIKKYSEDGAGLHAARISYYGFFSIFPLLLAFVSILGFALQDNPQRRQDILDSAFADVPVVGQFVRNDIGVIEGSGVALAIGIAVALWAGLGVMVALSQAFDDVWSVPRVSRLGYLERRLRSLLVLVIAGITLVASAIVGGLATSGRLGDAGESISLLGLSIGVDALALLAAFRLLTPSAPGGIRLLPGIVVASLGLLALQALGSWYVSVTISRATDTYGLFATVIGLLSWLALAAHLVLIAAEVNAVQVQRLWPRSLTGDMTPADERTLERYVERARYQTDEQVSVRWSRSE